MRLLIATSVLIASLAACSSDGSSSPGFNENAVRDAAIEWNPGDVDGVDSWVDYVQEFCGDDESIATWIEGNQSFPSSEEVAIYTSGCPDKVRDIARELAFPVPEG